jgi:hypothetical protein
MARLSLEKMISVTRKNNFEITTGVILLFSIILSSALSYKEPYFNNVIPVASALLICTFVRMVTKLRVNSIKLLGVLFSAVLISFSLAFVGVSLYDCTGIGIVIFCTISALECAVIE